jgi:hypothetical protein
LYLLTFATVAAVVVLALEIREQKAEIQELRRALEEDAAREAPAEGVLDGLQELGRSANEAAAIATLQNLISAQAHIQASGLIDGDADGNGEYGGFREMTGAARGRMHRPLLPPILSGAFRSLNGNGEATRSGYLFRIYLPDREGYGVGEPERGFTDEMVDPQACERAFCCYAWPQEAGRTGVRAFFTNQEGDILFTDATYSGTGAGPRSDAAFLQADSIMGPKASGGRGADGNQWFPFTP